MESTSLVLPSLIFSSLIRHHRSLTFFILRLERLGSNLVVDTDGCSRGSDSENGAVAVTCESGLCRKRCRGPFLGGEIEELGGSEAERSGVNGIPSSSSGVGDSSDFSCFPSSTGLGSVEGVVLRRPLSLKVFGVENGAGTTCLLNVS